MSEQRADDSVGYSVNQGEPAAGYLGVRDRPLGRPPGVKRRSPDGCPHEEFAVRADVNRINDVDGPAGKLIGFDLELAVDCLACLTPFEFLGLPMGMSPAHPTSSVDGLTLTAPVRPYGSPPEWGLDRPGFSVEVWVADDDAAAAGPTDQPTGEQQP